MRAVLLRAGLAATLLSLTPLVAAKSARAQGTEALPEAQARARLEAFNAELVRAASMLQGGYGKDPEAELERIEQAAQIASGIEQAFGEELSSAGAAYEAVKGNLARLNEELERARLAQRYSAAEASVRARHAGGQAASEEEWQALSDALSALEARANEGWQATVAHFASRQERLEQDRATLAAQAPAASAVAVAPAPDAPSDELLEAFRAANQERRTLERLLEEGDDALPPEALAAYLAAAARVSALSERAGRYYTTLHRHFLVADAFRKPDEEAFTTLPNLYQGDLITHGRIPRKKLTVRFRAKRDFCYALVGRFARFSGEEGATELVWTAQAKGAGLTRFDVPHTGPGLQVTQGVCPNRATRLTLTGTLEGAGRDNAFRYVVVGWPKERLPAFVGSYMRALDEDRCDDAAWTRAWTEPVPGSLLYRGQEPWLVVDAARPPTDELVLVNVNGARARVPKGEVSSRPQGATAFGTEFSFEGCPGLSGRGSPEAARLARCLTRVEKKYAKSVEREEGWVARAKTEDAREKAEARLASLRERWEKERAQQCDPLERRLGEKMRRTFERILDAHAKEAGAPFNRADQLQAEQEARPDLR